MVLSGSLMGVSARLASPGARVPAMFLYSIIHLFNHYHLSFMYHWFVFILQQLFNLFGSGVSVCALGHFDNPSFQQGFIRVLADFPVFAILLYLLSFNLFPFIIYHLFISEPTCYSFCFSSNSSFWREDCKKEVTGFLEFLKWKSSGPGISLEFHRDSLHFLHFTQVL